MPRPGRPDLVDFCRQQYAGLSLGRHTVYVGSFISAVICQLLSRPSYLSWPISSRHDTYVGTIRLSRVIILLGQAFYRHMTQSESFFYSACTLSRHACTDRHNTADFLLSRQLTFFNRHTLISRDPSLFFSSIH